jgi:probable rRNA maturation factor
MGIEGSTDVLTFPLSETRDPPLEGEIVLSVDTARAVAERLGHEAADEAALYVIHGLLHLCGYDDRTPSQRRKMRARERYHLQRLGIGVQR